MAPATLPLTAARRKRRRIRRIRRGVAVLIVLAPALWTLLADLARRGSFIAHFKAEHRAFYLASLGASFVFWSLLTFMTSRRRGVVRYVFSVVFLVLFTLSSGVQAGFFSIYRTYDSAEADVYTHSFFWPVVGNLPFGRVMIWVHFGVAIVIGGMVLFLSRAYVRPRRLALFVVLPFALAALVAIRFVKSSYRPTQASTSDVLYFHAVVASYEEQLHVTKMADRTRPQRRHPAPVPKLTSTNTKPRNVLFILQESQRFDVTCTEYTPDCQLATRASNRAVPARAPFLRWHSLGSSTSLACMTLWTGLLPSDPLVDLESAPTIFRYAKAAGYQTAYFTSQHLIFQNMRLQVQDEPLDQFAIATTLNMKAAWETGARDSSLSDYVIDHWDQLPEPFFVMVHYSNQHQPYVEDPNQSPFGFDETKPMDSLTNQVQRNKNVVYLSDLAVGRLLEKVRRSESGKRTVIMYTSDHSEGMGDHGWSGHTVSLFESEIHVPAWLDAPPGVLSDAELAHVRERKTAWLTHADMAPTFLDLIGAWDAPELAAFRKKMVGVPLTRALQEPVAIPLTNNSWIWESNQRNWGYIRGHLKVFGTEGKKHYRCFDLDADPGEDHDLGEEACGDLPALTRALFPSLVNAPRPYRPLR